MTKDTISQNFDHFPKKSVMPNEWVNLSGLIL